MRLNGKVAVITGTAGGIGRATALRFAEEGAMVVGADVSAEVNAETAQLVQDAGGKMVGTTVDVTSTESVRALFDLAEAEFGRIDIIFNNAGVMLPGDDDALTTPDDVIDRTLAINVKGVIHGCRYGIPALRRSGGGSIVNTASFVASVGAATPQIAYTASKGAVLSLTRELAVTHARGGIRVNALSPGPLHTELLMSFLDTPEKHERRLVHVPMGRFATATPTDRRARPRISPATTRTAGRSSAVGIGRGASHRAPDRDAAPRHGRSEVLPELARATAWVRCGPQNCSPF